MRSAWLGSLALALAIASAALAGSAAAAGLNLTAEALSATALTVVHCDPDGVLTSRTVSGGIVQTVTVEGIHGSCVGADFAVTLAAGSAAQLAEGRLCDVQAGSFGGTGDARTLGFDFSAAGVNDADVAATHVAMFQDGVVAASPPACS